MAARRSAEPLQHEVVVPRQPTPATVGGSGRPSGPRGPGRSRGPRGRGAGWRAALRRTPGGALLLKGVVFTLGLAFVVLGLVLVVAPGPLTIPPILLGLWIWSTEFAWADRQLDRARASARVAWDDARRRPLVSAVVTGGGLVALGVGIWLVGEHDLVARAREVAGV